MVRRWFAFVAVTLICASPVFCQSSATSETSARQPADSLDGPPWVTAKSWAIADAKTGKLLWGSQETEPRAIASTTKIMTAWVVLQLAEKDPSLLDQVITFSETADGTKGSTAGVNAGERCTVRELLYGLLLPSGNDAATAFAEHFGGKFCEKESTDESSAEENVAAFVAEMNRTAEKLGMTETKYIDPHGLGRNEASARDLLRLVQTAMQSELLRHYVNTPRHVIEVADTDGQKRELRWNNTNKLLATEGYDGVKTGTTNAAGACLVSSCHRGHDHLYVVVLGSTSSDARYTDTRNLLRWAWLQRGHRATSTSPPARD